MPRKPPSPDFSHLTESEVDTIVRVLRKLKDEEEKDLQRERELQADLIAVQENTDFTNLPPDAEVCEDCKRVHMCTIAAEINSDTTIYLCKECNLKRRQISISGSWFNSCGLSDVIDICNKLLFKATNGEGKDVLTQDKRINAKQAHEEQLQIEREEKERAESERQEEERQERERVEQERLKLEQEKERERAEQEQIRVERERKAGDAERTESTAVTVHTSMEPTTMATTEARQKEDAAGEKEDTATEGQIVDERPPENTQSQDAEASTPPPATGKPSDQPSAELMTSEQTADREQQTTVAKFGPGQVTEGLQDTPPLGYLELRLQVGADGVERAGLIIDVKSGSGFTMWKDIPKKQQNFLLYVKCYLVFPQPDRLVRMKTQMIDPAVDPAFEDQIIIVMSKDLLSKVKSLIVQIWQRTGMMKRNAAVASASIDLRKLQLEQPIVGWYPLFKPSSRQLEMATSPSSKSKSLSPKQAADKLEPPSTATM